MLLQRIQYALFQLYTGLLQQCPLHSSLSLSKVHDVITWTLLNAKLFSVANPVP